MFRPVALTRPTTSPGNASSIVVRSAPNTVDAYFVANGLPVRSQVITMPASNRPEQMRANAMRSRWLRSMLACTLNTNAEHRFVEVARLAVDVGARRRRRREVDDRVEQVADAEVGQCRAGEHRRGLAGQERRQVDVGADRVEQRRCRRSLLVHSAPSSSAARIGVDVLLRSDLRAAGRAGEAGEHAGAAVDHAAQVAVRSDRPRGRRRAQIDLLLDLVEQFERLHAGPIELVEERDHRQVPRAAHLEQLQGLRFDALGRVEHHHHRVDGRQHAVGVLGEVAVAGRVEQVQLVVAVREVQRRRGDRDAALLLHVHPVGRRRPPALVRLDRAARRDRTGVQQELLGERGLARVGVADDRERAPARRLGDHLLGHGMPTYRAWPH